MSSLSLLVNKPAIELGQIIVSSITEHRVYWGKEKIENKEVCMEEIVFPWDPERKVELFFQVKKSRHNIPGQEDVINKAWVQ